MTPRVMTRRFGTLRAAVVHGGELHYHPRGFAEGQDWRPGAVIDADGRAVLAINGLVAVIGDTVVVVDPVAFTAGDATPAAQLVIGGSTGDALGALGLGAADVDHVIITHGHADHFTGVLEPRDSNRCAYPRARHWFPAGDLPGATDRGHDATAVRSLEAALGSRVELTEGDRVLAPGVAVVAAPGESPGHQVAVLGSGAERLYHLGDLVHFPAEIDHHEWLAVVGRDAPALLRSRRRIYAAAARDRAVVLFPHAPFPGWGTIKEVPQRAWRWRAA